MLDPICFPVPAQAPSSFVIFVSNLLGHINRALLPDLGELVYFKTPTPQIQLSLICTLCLAFCTEAPRFSLYPTEMVMVLKGLYLRHLLQCHLQG